MELLPVDSGERLAKAKKVWDQLEARNKEIEVHLRDLDNLLEKDNEDAYSDLSDPFSDMGDSELAKPANRKVKMEYREFVVFGNGFARQMSFVDLSCLSCLGSRG